MEGGNDLPSLSLFNTPHSALSPYIVTPSHSPGDSARLRPQTQSDGREGGEPSHLSLPPTWAPQMGARRAALYVVAPAAAAKNTSSSSALS